MVYFTTFYYELDGGIMITASHNPSNCNGLKIVREEGKPVSSDTGLKEMEKLAFSGDFGEIVHKGTVEQEEIYLMIMSRASPFLCGCFTHEAASYCG